MWLKIIGRILIFAAVAVGVACGLNSVTKQQLSEVKVGDVLTYRFQKDGKSWFYADKIVRIEGERIYYIPSRSEATSGKADIKDFDPNREAMITKTDLLRYDTEQGEDKKVVIWINH